MGKKHKPSKHRSKASKKARKNRKKQKLKQIYTDVVHQLKNVATPGRDQGLQYGEKNLYKSLATEAFQKSLKHMPMVVGSDLIQDGGSCVFEYETARNEFIKFTPRPILLFYQVTRTKTALTEPIVAGTPLTDLQKATTVCVTTQSSPNATLSVAPGISAILDGCTISLNGNVITTPIEVGSHSYVYKALNMRLSTHNDRRRDNALNLTVTEDDRKKSDTGDVTEALVSSKKLLNMKAWNDTQGTLIQEVSLDGFPFLGLPRNNALANLDEEQTGENNNHQFFIPPGTKINIVLHFRSQPEVMIDQGNITDAAYFKAAKLTNNNLREKYKIKVKNCLLGYESFTPRDNSLNVASQIYQMKIPHDVPKMRYTLLSKGAIQSDHLIHLEPGTRSVYVGFMYGHG